jgi:hypothetical protein
MLTVLRQRLRQWLCPTPIPWTPGVDPARMARLELQVQTLEDKLDGLEASPAVPDLAGQGDMDAHLGAN